MNGSRGAESEHDCLYGFRFNGLPLFDKGRQPLVGCCVILSFVDIVGVMLDLITTLLLCFRRLQCYDSFGNILLPSSLSLLSTGCCSFKKVRAQLRPGIPEIAPPG